jgi:hypothetical protein
MKRSITIAAGIAGMLLAGSVYAVELTAVGGDMNDPTAWSGGTGTEIPTGTNTGLIDSSVTMNITGTLDDYNITQSDGTVTRNNGFTILNSTWDISGGTLSQTSTGSLLAITDSDISLSGTGLITTTQNRVIQITGGTFNMSGGTMTAGTGLGGDVTLLTSAVLNMSGGTLTAGDNLNISTSSIINLSGGDIVSSAQLVFGTGGSQKINFQSGDGTLTVASGGVNFSSVPDGTIGWYFDPNFEGSVTVNGWGDSQYRSLYGAHIFYDGASTEAFDDVFQVDGATLTVIPEPATLGLVGVAFAGLLALRRITA